jgi:hypothetical protein
MIGVGAIGEHDLVLVDVTDFAVKAGRDVEVEHAFRDVERPVGRQLLHAERQRRRRAIGRLRRRLLLLLLLLIGVAKWFYWAFC